MFLSAFNLLFPLIPTCVHNQCCVVVKIGEFFASGLILWLKMFLGAEYFRACPFRSKTVVMLPSDCLQARLTGVTFSWWFSCKHNLGRHNMLASSDHTLLHYHNISQQLHTGEIFLDRAVSLGGQCAGNHCNGWICLRQICRILILINYKVAQSLD